MSMINDMLRDLDKRQAPEVNGEGVAVQESLIEPQSPSYKKWLAIVLLVILVFVVLGGVFFQDLLGLTSENSQQAALPIQSSSDQSSSEPTDLDQGKLKPAVTIESKSMSGSSAQPNETKVKDIQVEPADKEIVQRQLDNASGKVIEVKSLTSPKTETVNIDVKKEEKIALNQQEDSVPNNAQAQEKIQNLKQDQVKSQETKKESLAQPEPILKTPEIKQEKPSKIAKNESALEPAKSMQVSLSPQALDLRMAEKAMKLLSQGADAQAYRELYAFIGEHEQDTESRTVLASYLLQQNRIAEVGDVLLNAPIQESPKLRQMKARWFAAQNEHKLALYTLSSNLPNIQEYPDYFVLLAAYYQRLGWTKEARDTYSSLVEFDETVADWWAGLGLALDRNNEKNKAIYAYQQALELTGLSTELFNFVQPRFKLLRETQVVQ